jgi:hypothetical protein
MAPQDSPTVNANGALVPKQGFVSYAHEDFELFERFLPHKRAIERRWGMTFWADPSIRAGHRWDDEIQRQIDVAGLFILLVSADFIASDYIYEQELPAIDARCQAVKGLILPVVLSRCAWSMLVGVFQAVPTEKGRLKPIVSWRPRSDGFDCAREQIDQAISNFYRVPLPTRAWARP